MMVKESSLHILCGLCDAEVWCLLSIIWWIILSEAHAHDFEFAVKNMHRLFFFIFSFPILLGNYLFVALIELMTIHIREICVCF